ncbi:hypothetical protein QTN25_004902 [Entamoeba marina]
MSSHIKYILSLKDFVRPLLQVLRDYDISFDTFNDIFLNKSYLMDRFSALSLQEITPDVICCLNSLFCLFGEVFYDLQSQFFIDSITKDMFNEQSAADELFSYYLTLLIHTNLQHTLDMNSESLCNAKSIIVDRFSESPQVLLPLYLSINNINLMDLLVELDAHSLTICLTTSTPTTTLFHKKLITSLYSLSVENDFSFYLHLFNIFLFDDYVVHASPSVLQTILIALFRSYTAATHLFTPYNYSLQITETNKWYTIISQCVALYDSLPNVIQLELDTFFQNFSLSFLSNQINKKQLLLTLLIFYMKKTTSIEEFQTSIISMIPFINSFYYYDDDDKPKHQQMVIKATLNSIKECMWNIKPDGQEVKTFVALMDGKYNAQEKKLVLKDILEKYFVFLLLSSKCVDYDSILNWVAYFITTVIWVEEECDSDNFIDVKNLVTQFYHKFSQLHNCDYVVKRCQHALKHIMGNKELLERHHEHQTTKEQRHRSTKKKIF